MNENQQNSAAPYGNWQSQLSAKLLTSSSSVLSEPAYCLSANSAGREQRLLWLASLPEEGGRVALRMRDNDITTVLPAPFSVRSRVNEYGGGAWCAAPGHAFFVNDADQDLYAVKLPRQDEHATRDPSVIRVTDLAGVRFADLQWDQQRQRLICVAEFVLPDGTATSALIAVNAAWALHAEATCETADSLHDHAITIVHQGQDFYHSPRVSADGRYLAWYTWQLPYMPWDATDLWLGEIDANGYISQCARVSGCKKTEQHSQLNPCWLDEQDSPPILLSASDAQGFWNLFATQLRTGTQFAVDHFPLHNDAVECAEPPWVFGNNSFVALPNTGTRSAVVAAQHIQRGEGSLVFAHLPSDLSKGHIASQEALQWNGISKSGARFEGLTSNPGGTHLAAIAHYPDRLPRLVEWSLPAPATAPGMDELQAVWVHESGEALCEPAAISRPQRVDAALPVVQTNADKDKRSQSQHLATPTVSGFFYAPCNPRYTLTSHERPPLVVLTHGGPTALNTPAFHPRVQFYTSRGFAVLDVCYRGSTGFGRDYHRALYGRWGQADVEDCELLVQELANRDRIDPERVVIRGGSAGGFTTLAALVFSNVFAGGACHYGIGDLHALAAHTHKFESRYLDDLIGPLPQAAAQYDDFSPINHVEKINCPVALFQGMQDNIVPPEQTFSVARALHAKGIAVRCRTFQEEGHGFRKPANAQQAIEEEFAFFCDLFAIEPADSYALPPLFQP